MDFFPGSLFGAEILFEWGGQQFLSFFPFMRPLLSSVLAFLSIHFLSSARLLFFRAPLPRMVIGRSIKHVPGKKKEFCWFEERAVQSCPFFIDSFIV